MKKPFGFFLVKICFWIVSLAIPAFSQDAYKFERMWGSPGTGDGQLNEPNGIAVDASGNVYVADTGNSRIQKFDSNGNFIAKRDFPFDYNYPNGVAVGPSGNVYVLLSQLGPPFVATFPPENPRVEKYDSIGNFITRWGSHGEGDGQFAYPNGVAVDLSGNVYVADTENHRIQKFDSNGGFITKWGFPGKPQYYSGGAPQGIAANSSGDIYIIVYRGIITFVLPPPPVPVIQRFDSSGNFITEWPLWMLEAQGVAVDSSGDVFVADSTYGNNRIQKFGPDGNLFTEWGSWEQGQGEFDRPEGVAIDSQGNVYVADTHNHRIQKFSPTGRELVSTPDVPSGPLHGVPGVNYSYSTSGSVSDYGHPVEYRFDWGDGTYSDWSSAPNASKSWDSPGSYPVKAQARCAIDSSVVSYWTAVDAWSPTNVNIFWIDLLSPLEHTQFGPCSLYYPVTFTWNAKDSFVSYEIHFSGMTGIPINVPASGTEIDIPSEIWEQIVMRSGPTGIGVIYWWVTGTRPDGTIESSNSRAIQIVSQPPANPNISPTGKRSKPTLTWQNNCNTKFKVVFGSDSSFTKKASFTVSIKDPTVVSFAKTLNPVQWAAVKRLVKNLNGSTVYWYIESWDGLGRYAKTHVMSFVLAE